MLHLFCVGQSLVRYGQEHHQLRSLETSTLIYQLFEVYYEDPNMSDKLKEFYRESIEKMLKTWPVEKRLEGLSANDLRKRLSPKERVEGLTTEELLKALSPEALEALTEQLKANESSTK